MKVSKIPVDKKAIEHLVKIVFVREYSDIPRIKNKRHVVSSH